MAIQIREILDSGYDNTYGGLSMIVADDGEMYLRMGDCFGPQYYGPMSDLQIASFRIISGLPEADHVGE